MSDVEPTGQEPITEPAAAAATTTTAVTEPEAQFPDWYNDPAKVQAEIQRLNRENAASRVNAKTAAAEEARQAVLKEIAKTLNPQSEEPVDPEALKTQLQAKDTTIRDLTVKSALSDALRDAGAKPLAKAAILGAGLLNDLDVTAADFDQQVSSKVSAYVAANPELKASQVAAVGGADLTGGAQPARMFTTRQLENPAFYQANKAEIELAAREGRII